MGFTTRPMAKIPGGEIPDDVQQMANRRLIDRFSKKLAAPLSMFLGEGSRPRLQKAFQSYLRPLAPYAGMAGMLGLPTYNQGLQNLQKSLQMAQGKVDPGDLRQLYEEVAERADDPDTGGYGFNQWASGIHEMARRGRLNDVMGRPIFTGMDARETARRAGHYMNSAATMAELNQRGVRDNIRALIEGTRNRNLRPEHLPVQARIEQLRNRYNQSRGRG